jgi:error-prone DNA polymerase
MSYTDLNDAAQSLPPYAELHCRSNFSFLCGASHPEEIVDRAHAIGYTSLALTDECSLAGVVRAHVEAKKCGLHLILGSEITFECGMRIVFLATNRNGYGNLAEFITLGRRRAPKGQYQLYRSDLQPQHTIEDKVDKQINYKSGFGSDLNNNLKYAEQSAQFDENDVRSEFAHLASLPDCLAIFLPDRLQDDDHLSEQANWFLSTFSERGWIGVALLHGIDDELWLDRLNTLSQASTLPLVATGDVLMHVRSRKPLQDTLTAVRLGSVLSDCAQQLQPNAEQHLRSRLRLGRLYPPALLQQTLRIAQRCTFSLDELRYQSVYRLASSKSLSMN